MRVENISQTNLILTEIYFEKVFIIHRDMQNDSFLFFLYLLQKQNQQIFLCFNFRKNIAHVGILNKKKIFKELYAISFFEIGMIVIVSSRNLFLTLSIAISLGIMITYKSTATHESVKQIKSKKLIFVL